MTDDSQSFDNLVEEVATQKGESPEVVRQAFNVQQKIKHRGIRGIRFMGKSAETMRQVGPMMAKKNTQRELQKRFHRK